MLPLLTLHAARWAFALTLTCVWVVLCLVVVVFLLGYAAVWRGR